MSVNKIKLRIGDSHQIKIPISLDFNTMDQSELVNRDFVTNAITESINPIVDYERVRFTPITSTELDYTIIENLNITVNLLNDDGNLYDTTTYGDVGFTNDDITYGKNRFLQSFLSLNFYDSEIMTDQNLVSNMSVYSKITDAEMVDGLALPANSFPIRYYLNNPITNPKGFAEGFYIYYYKSEMVVDVLPIELYMRAVFNNAATGVSTNLMATNDLNLPINEMVKKLHTRYLLTRTSEGFFYELDETYNSTTNVVKDGTNVSINLFEVKVK